MTLEDVLGELKYHDIINIISTKSAKDALKVVLQQSIDLIISDIQMPQMNGFEMASIIKANKKTKDIPIIFLTAAFKAEEFMSQGYEVGAIDYFLKPIEKYSFLNKIHLYTELFLKNRELEFYAKDLEIKVKDEIDKNIKQEKQLLIQNRSAAMGDMMGAIIHQWKQPLNSISMSMQALAIEFEDGLDNVDIEAIDEYRDIVKRQIKNMSSTMDDFQNFFKPQIKQTFKLYNNIEHIKRLIGAVYKINNIGIISNIDEDIEIFGYENELNQVIINILNNARDAINENNSEIRDIFISGYNKDDKTILTIQDCANGVPEDIIDDIFKPYITTKSATNGTGIGLDMSKTIIDKANGTIAVENSIKVIDDIEYKGALFTITLKR
jgi:signal transduction histidine kinase